MSCNNTSTREREDADRNNNNNNDSVTVDENLLYSAIEDGDSDRVDEILRKYSGSSVNVNRIFATSRMTPLHAALCLAKRNRLSIAKILVEHGADVNYIIPGNDFTVLHYALQDIDSDSLGANIENSMQKINLIKLLLKHGVNVNAKTRLEGVTTIHICIILCNKNTDNDIGRIRKLINLDILTLLLKSNDINVDCQDSRGRTPLHMAVLLGALDVVKAILDNTSADLTINDENGRSLMRLSVELARNLIDTDAAHADLPMLLRRTAIAGMIMEEEENRTKRHEIYSYCSKVWIDQNLDLVEHQQRGKRRQRKVDGAAALIHDDSTNDQGMNIYGDRNKIIIDKQKQTPKFSYAKRSKRRKIE